MAIDFNKERWEIVKQNARAWWDGKLGRPLLHMTITGRAPGRPEPKLSGRRDPKEIAYDLAVTPREIVDRWDYELAGREFLGDSFPCVWPDFGPGALAALLGARSEPGSGTVWFHPAADQPIKDIHLAVAPDNIWLRRIKDICRAARERWQGLVQVGQTDLGGNLDILATFRPGEQLLLDLVDFGQEVKRLTWEEHAMWWQVFEEINNLLRPPNPGYTAWAPIFSETPYYMLQCDFAYMIGPPMFAEFVKPELEASCKKLDHAFYHLDGVGQLAHLEQLLAIKELKGVQWVPGAGQPQGEDWPEVYQKILAAGKRAQFVGDWRNFEALTARVGGAENFIVFGEAPPNERPEVKAFLKRHGAW